MRVIQSVQEMASARGDVRRPLGLVPTMGALHQGHLSLIDSARRDSETLAASIFVNPTQFGPAEDYQAYPRDRERDLALLEQHNVDLVFAPEPEDMYPTGFDTWVDVGEIANRLEGAARPDHFRGVATVVTKLFAIVRPDRAYFGQKDAQQTVVIRRLTRDLNLGVEVVVLPTVREPDGLAMSSRNVYLNPSERTAALVLHRSLSEALSLFGQGERSAERIKESVESMLSQEALVSLEYVSVAHPDELFELEDIQGSALVSLAARVGRARLIDNVVLGTDAP